MLSPDERARVWNTSLQQHLIELFGYSPDFARQVEGTIKRGKFLKIMLPQPAIHWTDDDRRFLRYNRILAD